MLETIVALRTPREEVLKPTLDLLETIAVPLLAADRAMGFALSAARAAARAMVFALAAARAAA